MMYVDMQVKETKKVQTETGEEKTEKFIVLLQSAEVKIRLESAEKMDIRPGQKYDVELTTNQTKIGDYDATA